MQYKRIGYNVDVMRQSACLVVNPVTVNNFAVLFNCTPVGRGSDSMIAPTIVDGFVPSKIHDKRDDFDFDIVFFSIFRR